MISENSLFLLRHRSGRYLARGYGTNYSAKYLAQCGGEYGRPPYGGTVWRLTLDPMDALRARNPQALWNWIPEYYWDRGLFHVAPGPVCACCGDVSIVRHAGGLSPYRCEKHRERNPCVIEGCARTRAAPLRADGSPYLANNQDFCSEHWRRYVPPGSALRRAYLRFFREAKRYGWGHKGRRGKAARLDWRFRKFWLGLVKAARRRSAEGFIDEAEINRIMGWGEGG